MVRRKKPLGPGFLADLLESHVPLGVMEALAQALGYAEPKRTRHRVARFLGTELPLDAFTPALQRLPPSMRLVLRGAFGPLAEALAAEPEGAAALEVLRSLRIEPYGGPTPEAPGASVPTLVGSVLWGGEVRSLGRAPVRVAGADGAQLRAGVLQQHLPRLVGTLGDRVAHRPIYEAFTRALAPHLRSAGPANLPVLDARGWFSLGWLAVERAGISPAQPPEVLTRAVGALMAGPPADLLERIFRAWAVYGATAGLPWFETFGSSAWRLVGALEGVVDRVVHRLLSLAALETLPLDRWVEVARLADHLQRHQLLPAVAGNVRRSFSDARSVPVTDRRPDHNEGEPFRVLVPLFLRTLIEEPLCLGVVDLAFAPPNAPVLRFSGRQAVLPVCEAPHALITHVRRTSLGARFLDPLPRSREHVHGPGAEGLDALADLLGS